MALHNYHCDYHVDHYDWECTCGVTAPKQPWFDDYVRMCKGEISSKEFEVLWLKHVGAT